MRRKAPSQLPREPMRFRTKSGVIPDRFQSDFRNPEVAPLCHFERSEAESRNLSCKQKGWRESLATPACWQAPDFVPLRYSALG